MPGCYPHDSYQTIMPAYAGRGFHSGCHAGIWYLRSMRTLLWAQEESLLSFFFHPSEYYNVISERAWLSYLAITLFSCIRWFFGIIPLFDTYFNGIIPVLTPYFNGIIPLFEPKMKEKVLKACVINWKWESLNMLRFVILFSKSAWHDFL